MLKVGDKVRMVKLDSENGYKDFHFDKIGNTGTVTGTYPISKQVRVNVDKLKLEINYTYTDTCWKKISLIDRLSNLIRRLFNNGKQTKDA
jgi:hypothetical protein